jgi:hypothetical protein
MFSSIFVSVILALFILTLAWICLRRYNPQSSWLSWRQDRPVRSVFTTALTSVVVVPLAYGICVDVFTNMQGWPWYEYLWPAYSSLWLPWLLAAFVEQLPA